MPEGFRPRKRAQIPQGGPAEDNESFVFLGKGRIKSEVDLLVERMRNDDLTRPFQSRERMLPPPKLGPVFYLRQIAEPGGLQTCYPTSLLNAWIHQGAITRSEAQGIQDRFRSDLGRLFRHIPLYGYSTHDQNPYHFTELVGSELGKKPRFYNMHVAGFRAVEIEKIILQEINESNLLVVGDEFHATLVIGYKARGQELEICDPLQPQSIVTKKTRIVADAIVDSSDQYIGIIPSDF